LTTKDQGADLVRSRRWLYNSSRHQGSSARPPVPSQPGYFSSGLRLSCVRSARYLHTPGIIRNIARDVCNLWSIARVAARGLPISTRFQSVPLLCRLHRAPGSTTVGPPQLNETRTTDHSRVQRGPPVTSQQPVRIALYIR
jgi:hypothetical protein